MPFLRRRANMASEGDMRRRTMILTPGAQVDIPPMPTQSHGSTLPSSDAPPVLQLHLDDDDDLSHTNGDAVSWQQSRPSTASRPNTPPTQEYVNRQKRFSMLRFRNASDSQLSFRAKQQAERLPPMPKPPQIITTAPTNDIAPTKKPSRMGLATKLRMSSDVPRSDGPSQPAARRTLRKSLNEERRWKPPVDTDEPVPTRDTTGRGKGLNLSTLNPRQSESSRSDASSDVNTPQHQSPSTTPKKSSSVNPFFKLRRSRKGPEPLFPLSHLPQQNKTPPVGSSATSLGVSSTPRPSSAHSVGTPRDSSADKNEQNTRPSPSPAAALLGGTAPQSGHSSPTRANLLRGRSSTMSSTGRDSTDDHLLAPTARTSSSTGRKSFGDLFGLSRLRPNTELSRQGTLTPATTGSIGSKSNSLQLARESVTLPERREDESPAKYLARVEDVIGRGLIAAVLSKGADQFSAAVLRSHMRSFIFFGDPMDMALRKLLMEAELPKETQHIDRCLQAFANRYHECNPGVYSSPDQAYFIAFSLLILHTDVFNKNNKHKMQKPDYLKNAGGEGIFDDILECFYDNISYTPFIHVEDEIDIADRSSVGKSKRKQLLSTTSGDPARRAAKEPIDPYTLILDGDLEVLRPNLKEAMPLDDHYNYMGTASCFNLKDLQKTFFRTGILQIVSARSRPDAFMSEKTATNPQEAQQGIVDIKITKVGLLWRKDPKKRKTRSPWQEWGAILTGAQLYFFRNTTWVKSLMHQHESHIKAGNDGIPITFQPPLAEFKPDALMSTQGAVALQDTSYRKHKNAFVYVRPGGVNEILLADDDAELNDWLATLNYAAAFRTTGVRMRGVVADGQSRRAIRRLDSSDKSQTVQTPTGPVSIARGQVDQQMADDIQSARREVMSSKISEMNKRLEDCHKQLEEQLRNARHLQILAPIQPRTREQILSSAARISAQLTWTRMEIWKEKCHRDILVQDLEEDFPPPSFMETPTKQQFTNDRDSSPTPRPGARTERRTSHAGASQRPSKDLRLSHVPSPNEVEQPASPFSQTFQTPPQSATRARHASVDHTIAKSDNESLRHGSVSSIPASPRILPATPQVGKPGSRDTAEILSPKDSNGEDQQDDPDAQERNFLKQAGLLESREDGETADKVNSAVSTEEGDQVANGDRDKADKNKIRRSLHRTLREGAGHLSHHRSRRGRDPSTGRTSEDYSQDSTLARGTGSFVVHGKKASVIHLGTELQSLTQDDKARTSRRSQRISQYLADAPPISPSSVGDDDDFHSAIGDQVESIGPSSERRGSAASASTATARSFRVLHRKYSSAQATAVGAGFASSRSASAAGRLVIPSDGESDAAVSFSEGRRSPLPPIDNGSRYIEDEDESIDPKDTLSPARPVEETPRGARRNDEDDEDTDESTDDDSSEDEMGREPERAAPAIAA